MHELLTPAQMHLADRAAIDAGTPGITLMEHAGTAVAGAVQRAFPGAVRVVVVCGIGNNGGDGFVVARLLSEAGLEVSVELLGEVSRLVGDARLAFDAMDTALVLDGPADYAAADVIVDAVFGAGLNRPILSPGGVTAPVGTVPKGAQRNIAAAIDAINASHTPVVAVDLPSGIDGLSGQVLGTAIRAHTTVTFFRFKPAHLLMPGRAHCGERVLAQIGIEDAMLAASGVAAHGNAPALWRDTYPVPALDGHKYHRGHCVVVSGPLRFGGAARLAATAALRVGAGLVTLASPNEAVAAHASHLTTVMVAECEGATALDALLADTRFTGVALGFGLPPDVATRGTVLAVLARGRPTVLDAGALVAFADEANTLLDAVTRADTPVVLTPHDGEFARLFPDLVDAPSKLDRARSAAVRSGATVVLKGPDTVVASPSGALSVNDTAPPWLATAGSGDVLAGVIAGLLTQGMPAFEAASAAVWLHGQAAHSAGPALVASDLDAGLRSVIQAHIHSGSPDTARGTWAP
ncbi:MAG: NAD(P)H-hydrate dehydratase [Pseudomonadota bacterium]